MFRSVTAAIALLLSGCALLSSTAGLRVSTEERERLSREYVGREFVLASSMYAGDFFGNAERRLIDPRPADVLELYHHDGDRAVVKPFSGDIIYAGTPVRIREVVFPTGSGMDAVLDERSALAPTAHTWLVVEPTEGDAIVMVLVLPRAIEGVDAFRSAVQERLGSMQWVSSWLTQRDPKVLDAIYAKRVQAGMSKAEMVAALGHPRTGGQGQGPDTLDFVADYGDLQVSISGNQITGVVSIKEKARLAREKAGAAAAEARAKAEQERKAREAEQAKAQALADEQRKKDEAKAAREKKKADTLAARQKAKEDKKRAREDKKRAAKEAIDEKARIAQEARDERARVAQEARDDKDRVAQQAKDEKARLARQEQEDRIARAKVQEASAKRDATQAAEVARLKAEATAAEKAALEAKRQAEANRKAEDNKVAAARAGLEKEIATSEARIAEVGRKHDTVAALKVVETARKKNVQAQSSFAAKIDEARRAVEAARVPKIVSNEGKIGRRLGLKTKALDAETARSAGLSFPRGAHVVAAVTGGEGDAAGLRGGDVVVTFDGHAVAKPGDLSAHAAKAPLDRKVYMEVMRGGHREVLSLPAVEGVVDQGAVIRAEQNLASVEERVTRERAGNEQDVQRAIQRLAKVTEKRDAAAGPLQARLARARVALAKLNGTPSAAKKAPTAAVGSRGRDLGISAKKGRGGVLVVSVRKGSEGEVAGLKARDIIVAFDGREVADASQLAAATADAEKERKIFIEVLRGKKQTVLALPAVSEIAAKAAISPKAASRPVPRPASPRAVSQPAPAESDAGRSGPARLVDPDADDDEDDDEDDDRKKARGSRPAFPKRRGR